MLKKLDFEPEYYTTVEPELDRWLTLKGIDIDQIINIETQGEYIRVWYRG